MRVIALVRKRDPMELSTSGSSFGGIAENPRAMFTP